jgi:hypothetical protein
LELVSLKVLKHYAWDPRDGGDLCGAQTQALTRFTEEEASGLGSLTRGELRGELLDGHAVPLRYHNRLIGVGTSTFKDRFS